VASGAHRDFLDSAVVARLSRLPFHSRLPMVGTMTGMHKSPHRGSSVEFAEYRKYVPGDDIRHVDWRVYARTDKFYMKEFEADTNLRCYLVLDCSGSMQFAGDGTSKFDLARRLAATLAYILVHQGDSVGLMCFSDGILRDIPPRHTPGHLAHIYDAMNQVNPTGKTDLVKTLHDVAERIRRRATVIVLSDFFTEINGLLDCFKHIQFRNHDLAVFHLLDESELTFQFDRPIRFSDLESSFNMITDTHAMRSLYLEELESYLADLRRGCLEFNVDYQRVSTGDEYEKTLADFLLQRLRKS